MIRRVPASMVAAEPHEVWNAFIDLLACTDFQDLAPNQRAAHLAFWYDSEIQNGGHYQYFLNSAGSRAPLAIDALNELGLACQAKVLSAALRRWRSDRRIPPATADDVIHDADLAEFEDLDEAYHGCSPEVLERLEEHLVTHRENFVHLDPDA